MPSPLGHSIAGLTVHVFTSRDALELSDVRRAGALVLAASAPDVDFLFKLIDGRNHHQQETHSIGFALLLGLAAALFARLAGSRRALPLGGAVVLACLSHVLLDYTSNDSNPPIGLMALWPFRHDFHKLPFPLFLDVGRTWSWRTVRNNLLAGAWEAVVLLPVLVLVWRLRRRRLLG